MNSRLQPKLRVPPAPRAGSVSHSVTIGKPLSDSDSETTPVKPPRRGVETSSFRFKEDPEVTSTFLYQSDHSNNASADESDKSENWYNKNTLSNQVVNFVTPNVCLTDFSCSEHSFLSPKISFENEAVSEHSDGPESVYENIESLSVSRSADNSLSRGEDSSSGSRSISRERVKDDTLDLEAYLFDSDGETKPDTMPLMPKTSIKPLFDSDSDDQNEAVIPKTGQLKPPPKPFRPSSISVNDILEYKDPSTIFTSPPVTPNLCPEVFEDPVYDIVHVEARSKKKVNLGKNRSLSDSFVKIRRTQVTKRTQVVAHGGDPLTAVTRPFSMMIPDKPTESESLFQRSQSFGSSPVSPQSSTRQHAKSTPNEPCLFTKLFRPTSTVESPSSRFYLSDNLSVEETDSPRIRKLSDTVNRYKQAIVDNLTPAVFSIPQPTRSTFFVDPDQDDAIYHGGTLDNQNVPKDDLYYGDSTLDLHHARLSAANSVSDSLRDEERIYETPGTLHNEGQSGYYSIADSEKPRWGPSPSVSGSSGRVAPGRPAPPAPPSKPLTPSRPSAPPSRPFAPPTVPQPSDNSPSPEHRPLHSKLSRLSVSDSVRPQNRQNRVISMAFDEDEIIPISDFSQTEYVNIQDIT